MKKLVLLVAMVVGLVSCGDVDAPVGPVATVTSALNEPMCTNANGFNVPNRVTRCLSNGHPELAFCGYQVGSIYYTVVGCRVFNCYVIPGSYTPLCGYTLCVSSC